MAAWNKNTSDTSTVTMIEPKKKFCTLAALCLIALLGLTCLIVDRFNIVVLLVVGEAEASPVLVVYMLLIILGRLVSFSLQVFTHSAGRRSPSISL